MGQVTFGTGRYRVRSIFGQIGLGHIPNIPVAQESQTFSPEKWCGGGKKQPHGTGQFFRVGIESDGFGPG